MALCNHITTQFFPNFQKHEFSRYSEYWGIKSDLRCDWPRWNIWWYQHILSKRYPPWDWKNGIKVFILWEIFGNKGRILKNYIERWDTDRISLKNDKSCSSLVDKYLHMYLYDEDEVRRVVDVVWSTRTSRPAKYQVVSCHTDDLINAEQGNVNYLINAELH